MVSGLVVVIPVQATLENSSPGWSRPCRSVEPYTHSFYMTVQCKVYLNFQGFFGRNILRDRLRWLPTYRKKANNSERIHFRSQIVLLHEAASEQLQVQLQTDSNSTAVDCPPNIIENNVANNIRDALLLLLLLIIPPHVIIARPMARSLLRRRPIALWR